MQDSDKEAYQPDCPIAHDLINQLSAMVGHCDLLLERMPQDPALLNRALMIQKIAKSMAEQLGKLQCDLARIRITNNQKPSLV